MIVTNFVPDLRRYLLSDVTAGDRRLFAAYHEAGHAVARIACGSPVRRVFIAEDGSGGTAYLSQRSRPRPPVDAICCLAGPIAEAQRRGLPHWEVLEDTTDLRMARAALAPDASRTGLDTAASMAADLVWRYADAIEAVARALLDGGSIDGDALAAIVAAGSSSP
jgi:hypothetical protein